MALREVLVYKNPILRKVSTDVVDFDAELHRLLDDMYDTMLEHGGIGLASVQVGVIKKVFILNIPGEDGVQHIENLCEFINPQIISRKGETSYEEGCLSVPSFKETIFRDEILEIKYQTKDGKVIKRTIDGLEAIAFQHEMDHLNGILFIDKLSYIKRKKFEKAWKKEYKK